MSMQQQPEFKTPYIPPINCKCGGTAMLVITAHQRTKNTSKSYACSNVTRAAM